MLAIIGGTGLNTLPGLEGGESREFRTAWAESPVIVTLGRLAGRDLLFLPRHGPGHLVPPHRINYRANIAALREAGARQVVGVAAVGGIREDCGPATLVLPEDLIDYTWGRAQSFWDGEDEQMQHIEFAPPYAPPLQDALRRAAARAEVPLREGAVLGVTQGPRLESAAEVRRLARDGCDLVGMTGMPEAALAREAGLDYACLAVVVNWAAGIGSGAIHAEIEESINRGMAQVRATLEALLRG